MGDTKLEALFWQPAKLLQVTQFAVEDVEVYQQECRKLRGCLDTLASCMQAAVHMLRNGSNRFCEHPTRCILDDTTHALELCSTLISNCGKGSRWRRLFTITTATEFKKAELSLENAIANMKWLLNSVTDEEEGSVIGIPPISTTFPNLSVVWSLLSKLQGGTQELREAAAIDIASMASASEQNGQFIISEGGISLLLKALHDGTLRCKVMVATAFCNLARIKSQVHEMVQQGAIPSFVSVLQQGLWQVQIILVQILAEMIVQDREIQTALGDAKAVMHLAALLLETIDDDIKLPKLAPLEVLVNHRAYSVQEVANSEGAGSLDVFCPNEENRICDRGKGPLNDSNNCKNPCDVGSSSNARNKEDHEFVKLKTDLQVQVTRTLCLLAADHLDNSRTIAETRAMLALAKLIEVGHGEVQKNAIRTIMELASVAEEHPGFRKFAFKLSSPAAKAAVTNLHQIILDESADPELQVWCIKAVGSLARQFSSKGNDLIEALVLKLSNTDKQYLPVIVEAIYALLKFIDEENFLCQQHCLAIVDVPGFSFLVQLAAFESVESVQFPAIHLLSQLALHAGRERQDIFLETAALSVLTSVASSFSTLKRYSEFSSRDDISRAIFHLEVCLIGETSWWPSSG